MGHLKTWFLEQWKDKKFRAFTIFTVITTILLCAEFCLFEYSVLKILRYLVLYIALYVIAWIDGKTKIIPNKILLTLMSVRTIILVVECIVYRDLWLTFLMTFAGGLLIGGGVFLCCYLITRGSVGAGDVKLFGVLGYYFGTSAIFTNIFLTVVCSAFYSIIQLILKRKGLKEEIPFAPFVFVGTLVTMALGV